MGAVARRPGDQRRGLTPSAESIAPTGWRFARTPDGWEKDTALTFFDQQERFSAERKASNEDSRCQQQAPAGMDPARAAALVDFCHMLLNSNEFVYLN